MDNQTRSKMNTQIYEEACNWFVECRAGDLDDAGRREFDRWLRKSPEHLSSYLEIAAIWHEGPSLDPKREWSTEKLIHQALNTVEVNVVPFTGSTDVASNPVSSPAASGAEMVLSSSIGTPEPGLDKAIVNWRRRFSIAASIVVGAILLSAIGVWTFSSPIYATTLGEQRSIQFEDGSTVELNSRSKIRVKYSKQERDVELLEGQALFHVAHDTSRPFIVAVGATRVRAVGTQFDVYRKSTGTVVTVVEGRVAVYGADQALKTGSASSLPSLSGSPQTATAPLALPHGYSPESIRTASTASLSSTSVGVQPNADESSSVLLAAGEQLTVTADAAQKSANPNIASATAWREREIVFESATLSDVAEEFNRYNHRQLVIEDSQLYGFHISGVFSSTDPDSLIRFLRQRPGVKVTERHEQIYVERATR
jgi:transmembrane sensor